MVRTRCGSIVCRSVSSGISTRALVRSDVSSVAVMIASSHSGARSFTSPFGPAIKEPPEKLFPPSVPTSCTSATNTPCSEAISRASRSHRSMVLGPGLSSLRGVTPRAGDAEAMKITCAPSSAAIVPDRLCQASSHTSIAARPQLVSNARISKPRSTKRSSSNSPYVGRKTLRWM